MNDPMIFVLTSGDKESPTWKKLLKHLQTVLQARREENDAPLSEPDTQKLRGEIALLKELIDLDTDRPLTRG